MIERIGVTNQSAVSITQTRRNTSDTSKAGTTSFSSVMDSYASGNTTSVYSTYNAQGGYVSGVNRGSAYAPTLTQITDVKAVERKLEEMKSDFGLKHQTGFFDDMDDNEKYAYIYERYAAEFGADFLDYEWQSYTQVGQSGASSSAKYAIVIQFKWVCDCVSPRNSVEEYQQRKHDQFSNYFGYGDMTAEEKYNAILSEYSASGDKSFAATYKMLWLLESTGAVDSGLIHDVRTVIHDKQRHQYAALDMSVTDMALSKYANEFYAFDTDAEIMKVLDYIKESNRNIHRPNSSSVDAFNSKAVQEFFEKLIKDLAGNANP